MFDIILHMLWTEYTTVLNILGLHKIANKISIIDIWQGFEYASSSEYTSVTQGPVKSSPSYMLDRFLSIPRAVNLLGLEYRSVANMPRFCVNCILKILSILNVLSADYTRSSG